MTPNLEIFAQLALAVVLGSLIGLERRIAHKTAGMRTFAMVSLGSALFTLISLTVYRAMQGATAFDPSRMPSQIIVGIGFLGAGMIVYHHQHLEGLTTGAGLWVAAGIGMAVAFGMYAVAIFTTILLLVVFEVFSAMERRLVSKIGNHEREERS